MKSILPLLLLTALSTPSHATPKADFSDPTVIDTIAFGSCFNPKHKKFQIFDGILKHQPDAFLLLGDNIYGDTEDMEVLRAKYAELDAIPGFAKLRETSRVLATWDDHDYGINDGGNTYKKREESAAIFLDFFKDPADSPRRQREGIYGSYTFGPEGRVCQIIMLDTRYFRDVLPRTKEKRKPDAVGWYDATDDTSMTQLGEQQWNWLETQLQVPANLRIIASSVQVLASEKGMENWGHVPHERKRLFDLLKKHKAHQSFFISGDVHFGELSKMDVDGYPIYDMTSSGMSHPSPGWARATNSFRVGKAHPVLNAGLIEINWEAREVSLSFINPKGEKLATHKLPFAELEF
ncbi:MAG: alkaline phosphatase D family protein [Luteolibacter sp.]